MYIQKLLLFIYSAMQYLMQVLLANLMYAFMVGEYICITRGGGI